MDLALHGRDRLGRTDLDAAPAALDARQSVGADRRVELEELGLLDQALQLRQLGQCAHELGFVPRPEVAGADKRLGFS